MCKVDGRVWPPCRLYLESNPFDVGLGIVHCGKQCEAEIPGGGRSRSGALHVLARGIITGLSSSDTTETTYK
jgi:hypothetical protein